MRLPILLFLFLSSFGLNNCEKSAENLEKVNSFKQELTLLESESKNPLLSIHFASIRKVINAEKVISAEEAELLEQMYDAFLNDSLANPSELPSYLNRQRTMIIAWTSPTDNKVSFGWLRLPKNWDQEKKYPLYVHLHGYWEVAEEPIDYMSFTFREAPSTTTAFEDGYWLSPWGRGNKWYQGISKNDIWEAISEAESLLKIDSSRKYLSGHSMGGFGTWYIAQESPEEWAAIGIHSGALFFKDSKLLKSNYADSLKNTPAYFVWGDKEEPVFEESNELAISLLKSAGNTNTYKTLFEGGHDYYETDVENMYEWMRTFRKE